MKKSIALAAATLFAVTGLAACSDQPNVEEQPVEVVEDVDDGDEVVEEEIEE